MGLASVLVFSLLTHVCLSVCLVISLFPFETGFHYKSQTSFKLAVLLSYLSLLGAEMTDM